MEILSIISGYTGVRVPMDEVSPKTRPSHHEFAAAVRERYDFASVSDITINGPIIFQLGRMAQEKSTPVVFNELQVMHGSDVVLAQNTDLADAIIDDVFNFLDERFSYRFNGRKFQRCYLSTVVVDFDRKTKNVLSSLSLLEGIVSHNSEKKWLKRLAFGRMDADPGMYVNRQLSPIEQIEAADFTIERRVGTAPELNRFFCAAPLRTADHLERLQQIENSLTKSF